MKIAEVNYSVDGRVKGIMLTRRLPDGKMDEYQTPFDMMMGEYKEATPRQVARYETEEKRNMGKVPESNSPLNTF